MIRSEASGLNGRLRRASDGKCHRLGLRRPARPGAAQAEPVTGPGPPGAGSRSGRRDYHHHGMMP
eukprot:559067-Hanusia_phi.AAC.1